MVRPCTTTQILSSSMLCVNAIARKQTAIIFIFYNPLPPDFWILINLFVPMPESPYEY